MAKNIYAGISIKSDIIEVVFAEQEERKIIELSDKEPPPFESYQNGEFNWEVPFSTPNRKEALQEIASKIILLPKQVKYVGVGTYGPISSVSLKDRKEKDPRYGQVSPNTLHESLRGFEVYRIIRDILKENGCAETQIIIHTDVNCGAISEKYVRRIQGTMSQNDMLVFINIAEGVGGAFVTGTTPIQNAHHTEMGYSVAQVSSRDKWAIKLLSRSGEKHQPLFIEKLCSGENLMKRSRAKSLKEVPVSDWSLESYYLSQLCATVTVMLAPHKILLAGPVIEQAPNSINLIPMIRKDFNSWIKGPLGPHMTYNEMENLDEFIGECINDNPILQGALILAAQMDVYQ